METLDNSAFRILSGGSLVSTVTEIQQDKTEKPGTLWESDQGVLSLEGRRVLLQLIRGPFLDENRHPDLWKTLVANRATIAQRCNDLLLDLVVDVDRGIAFVRNAPAQDESIPKATRSINLGLIDTLLLLVLRRELLLSLEARAIIDKNETLDSLTQYRPLARLDEAAFAKKLSQSWTKMRTHNIVMPLDESETRFEVSPVLSIVFGADEADFVAESIEQLLDESISSESVTAPEERNL